MAVADGALRGAFACGSRGDFAFVFKSLPLRPGLGARLQVRAGLIHFPQQLFAPGDFLRQLLWIVVFPVARLGLLQQFLHVELQLST